MNKHSLWFAATAIAAVVHIRSNPEDLLDPLSIPLSSFRQQGGESLELREISLLLGRKKAVVIKEWDYVVQDCSEVVDLVIPDPIVSPSHRPALEVPLELRENHFVALGYVEAQGDFPGHPVIAPRSKADIEASFTIREASQVVADVVRHSLGIEHHRAFPADFPHRSHCHCHRCRGE